jgi:hypothetical protein
MARQAALAPINPPEPAFPEPIKTRGRRRWRLSEIVNYERALAGLPPLEIDPFDERWLTAAQVRGRFGGVSDMWLYRRLHPEDAFEKRRPRRAHQAGASA